MGKPTICLGENKGADQLRSNCEADQRLCFRYSANTVPLLLKSEILRFNDCTGQFMSDLVRNHFVGFSMRWLIYMQTGSAISLTTIAGTSMANWLWN